MQSGYSRNETNVEQRKSQQKKKKGTRKRRRTTGDKVLGVLIILTMMAIAVLCGVFLGKILSGLIKI